MRKFAERELLWLKLSTQLLRVLQGQGGALEALFSRKLNALPNINHHEESKRYSYNLH